MRALKTASRLVAAITVVMIAPQLHAQPSASLYGQVGKLMVVPGQRDALIAILLDGTKAMPGCLSYIIAKDARDDNAIWITEIWDSQRSHDASLSLPAVRAAIHKGGALILKMDGGATLPVGGQGLPSTLPSP